MTRSTLIATVFLASLATGQAMSAELMDDAQLADVRGGIDIGPFTNISFACTMTTTVNGQLLLTTKLNITPQGEQMTQTAGAGTQSLSNSQQYGINVSSLPQTGALLPGPGGGTAAIQNAVGQFMNAVINTASNQTIVQNTTLQLGLANLTALKQNASQTFVGGALTSAMNTAALQLSGH